MCTKMEQPFYPDSFFSGYSQEYGKAALKAAGMALNLSAEPFRALKPQMPHHPHSHHPHSHHLRGQEEGSSAASAGGYFPGSLQQQQQQQQQQPSSASEGVSPSLKLASPELERLIAQNSHGVITTTPTPPGAGPQYYFSRGATEEQEGFADGFVKALDDLHKMNHLPPPNVSIGASSSSSPSSSSSTVSNGGYGASSSSSSSSSSSLPQEPPPVYTNLTSSFNPSSSPASSGFPSANLSYLPHPPHPHHALAALGHHHHQHHHPPSRGAFKEEPQTVPEVQSPPVSPINMEDQERIKVERKRLRNRLAATKCRKRKLERIARLEEKVKTLKSDNAGLSSAASALRDQVAQLKQKVMSHVNSGCQLLLTAKMQQSF